MATENTVEGPTANGLIGQRLSEGKNFDVDGFPSFDTFRELADLSNQNGREYGIQTNLMQDQAGKTIYVAGKEKNIKAPRGFHQAAKIFFHSHPEMSELRSPRSVLSMTPSFAPEKYFQILRGDYGESGFESQVGGYLNIISSLGVTFLIAQQRHSEVAAHTAEMRQKLGVADKTSAPLIFIKSGICNGEVIDDFREKFLKGNHLGSDKYLAFNVRVPGLSADYSMLFVTFEELEKSKVTPAEICYGAGLDALAQHLGINIYHRRNLYQALHSQAVGATI